MPGQVGVPERRRVFEATWTMVPSLVREAARVCADAAAGTPGAARAWSRSWRPRPPADRADPELAAAFFNRAVAYLDRG